MKTYATIKSMAQTLSQIQRTSQIQTQRMSQRQIQSLNLLAMSAEDLRDEIYAAAEKNPALEIEDDFEGGVKNFRIKSTTSSDYAHIGVVSSAGEEKSQAFQEILESRPDERKTLYEHLMEQLSVADVTPAEEALCQKIIGNLDEKGFYILAPVTLLNPVAGEDFEMLQKCLSIVQGFDPSGVCVANTEESLLLQAIQKEGVNSSAHAAAIFLLDGHLDFLNPPVAQKALKKIQDFIEKQKNLSFNEVDFSQVEKFTERDVQNAIDFIKTLDPLPARDFSLGQTQFITPDIYVEKVPSEDDENESGGYSFKVRISDKIIPKIKISSDFAAAQKDSEFARAAVKDANVFLESLEFREATISKAAAVIVQKQKAFFQNGTGHLVPLRQQDVADAIGVHESTISRMSTSKYIQCEWGLFPVKYFFTNAIARPSTSNGEECPATKPNGQELSQESVKVAIEKILEEHAADKKKLSDQKIADILAERGMKVARRTVAKYRSQLNIGSSYNRQN